MIHFCALIWARWLWDKMKNENQMAASNSMKCVTWKNHFRNIGVHLILHENYSAEWNDRSLEWLTLFPPFSPYSTHKHLQVNPAERAKLVRNDVRNWQIFITWAIIILPAICGLSIAQFTRLTTMCHHVFCFISVLCVPETNIWRWERKRERERVVWLAAVADTDLNHIYSSLIQRATQQSMEISISSVIFAQ